METETRIFGIRHHGPGSARSLRAALEAWQPDCVLVEGPPDAEAVLPLLAHTEMKPPVALLIYAPEQPSQSVYYPFAVFSPEWQAIDYGLRSGATLRFMDLPQTHRFALEANELQELLQIDRAQTPPAPTCETPPGEELDPIALEVGPDDAEEITQRLRQDPLDWIAEAAGYSDGETWWEHMVEQRHSDLDIFQAVTEMMTALREAAPPNPSPVEAKREAWMRQTIRRAQREGFQRIAVVCGAWHAPALVNMPSASDDVELLKAMPKNRVAATWVPWTYGRLTYASGYGAGITSPAWYEHLWRWPDCVAPHWMTSAAALFRQEDLPASPASVIEAVRLSEALAAVRDRPIPGLPELWEAAQSVFCFGSDLPMRLIQERLVVGERLGHVPDDTPMLPIQQDVRSLQKRLRLAPEASQSEKDLDLRNQTDLERSVLLHRLNLLNVPWGAVQRAGGKKGTFHEVWRLQWHPEFEVKLIEANVYGNTVRGAASQKVRESSEKMSSLADLTMLVEQTLMADLPEVMPYLMSRLENLAALTSDIPHLMGALPPLAGVLRYGNVRQTDASMVTHAVDGMAARICIGLPAACASLNDDAAAEMYPRILAVDEALRLLQNEAHLTAWNATLQALSDMALLHGLIDGRCCRLLHDHGVYDADEIERRMNLALSPAGDPARAAAWIDGLLRDSGEILVHTDSLWPILDRWVASLTEELFPQILPLVRRTFSGFPPPLRRQLGERARAGGSRVTVRHADAMDIDAERGGRVLPLLSKLLGLEMPGMEVEASA